jgi:hypothetical protein
MLADAPSWLTSSTTLSVVSALGTILAGIGAIWVLLVAGPRYRLRYGPLTSRRDGEKWKADIYLASRGRRDITRNAFDEGRPIELNIGVPILTADCNWNSEQFARTVAFRKKGSRLLVGPDLIRRRQDLRFTVTTVEEPKGVACQASLIDVSIRRQRFTPRTRSNLALAALLVEGGIVGGVSAGIADTFFGTETQTWLPPIVITINTVIVLSIWNSRFKYPTFKNTRKTLS